jgi:hypothetical protein
MAIRKMIILLGGEERVRIESTVDGYLLESLAFVGLSFADFSNSERDARKFDCRTRLEYYHGYFHE